jgi:alpha-ketoglutarate-dependent taurine dioxygenase
MTPLPDRHHPGPQAWYGPAMAQLPERWLRPLTTSEVTALRAAAQAAIATSKPLITTTRDDFPLGEAAPLVEWMRVVLQQGHGFCLLRGLPFEDMDRAEIAMLFWGLGAHFGDAVSQNGSGHVLGHVTDLGLDYDAPTTRGYQTSARLPYHTDYADIVGLCCLQTAKQGGRSSIVSSVTVYNEMLKRRPDLVRVLREPLYRTRWGEVGSDRPAWIEVPAFNLHPEGVVTTYVRSSVRKAQLMPEVPRLRPEQTAAMDMFDELAADPTLHLDMSFEQGDLQFVNNHWILHSRTAYEDHTERTRRRHLLRLWLACDDGPPFPPAMTESFQGLTHNGRPNGISIPGVPQIAPLEAA